MKLTDQEKKALADFRAKYGRQWKTLLRDAWMNGNYPSWDDDTATLQCLRNSEAFGPRGLIAVRPKDLAIEAVA